MLKTKPGCHNRLSSTYDEYVSEVESGHLVWSPTHESEDFWKENGLRIGQENNGKTVQYVMIHPLRSQSALTDKTPS